jgi:hypothetical protein
MRWWRNRRSVADWEAREVETISLLYAGRFDDAADELDEISSGYAKLGNYPGAARALVRRVDPLVNALRMGELGADSFRLGDMVARIPAGLRAEFDEFRDVSSGRQDQGTPLTARTVLEGMVYLQLVNRGAPVDHARHVSGSREGDVFYLRYHGTEQERIRLLIPVRPVDEARFGDGRSDLVDAGQWVSLAAEWTSLLGVINTAADPDTAAQVRPRIRDAYRQALAFVPAGAEEVAHDGVWTPASRADRSEHPELFRRSWLEGQLDPG